jgi:hypothetical protein
MALKQSNEAVNAEADAVAAKVNNGYLRIYGGVRPATADTALSNNPLLAELRFANPASPAAVAGVLTFSGLQSDTSADATGTATFYRTFKSDGVSPIVDGSVSATGGGGDLELNTTSLVAGAAVEVTAFSWTMPKG